MAPVKQLRQLGQGTRRDDVRLEPLHGFQPLVVNNHTVVQPEGIHHGLKKPALFANGFNKVNLAHAHDRHHEAGEARARPHVHPHRLFRLFDKREQLGRIKDMPPPGIGQGGRADQIEPGLPVLQHQDVAVERAQCFT